MPALSRIGLLAHTARLKRIRSGLCIGRVGGFPPPSLAKPLLHYPALAADIVLLPMSEGASLCVNARKSSMSEGRPIR